MHPFSNLTPAAAISIIEQTYDLVLDGSLTPYNSYINRVYGVKDQEGKSYIAKFYRPGRWSAEALEDEHYFLEDCADSDITVALPLRNPDGHTLGEAQIDGEYGASTLFFALFEKKAGRNFDAEGDEDWLRLGRLLGRVHQAGRLDQAPYRPILSPETTTAHQVQTLLTLFPLDLAPEAGELCQRALKLITPLFDGLPFQRIHGDCHRGNILSRGEEGLLLMDFDDMVTGPVVQDLWLLIPGYREDCGKELSLIMEGYEEFSAFDPRWWDLVEPLRFMRMIHFLSWTAAQREDPGFTGAFPGWGTKGFWIKELEDLKDQLRRIEQQLL